MGHLRVGKQKSLRRLCLGRALGAEIGETFLDEVGVYKNQDQPSAPPLLRKMWILWEAG